MRRQTCPVYLKRIILFVILFVIALILYILVPTKKIVVLPAYLFLESIRRVTGINSSSYLGNFGYYIIVPLISAILYFVLIMLIIWIIKKVKSFS